MWRAGRQRALVVGGDPSERDALADALRRETLDVNGADTWSEASRLMHETRPAVVVVHWVTGADATQLHHALATAQNPPVVLLALAPDEPVPANLDARSIQGVIRRSADPREIATLVRACAEILAARSLGTMCLATVVAVVALMTSHF